MGEIRDGLTWLCCPAANRGQAEVFGVEFHFQDPPLSDNSMSYDD